MKTKQTVYIIDDDEAVRDGLEMLLESVGLESRGFASGKAFLRGYCDEMSGCIVLDIRMPKMSGLQVQRRLKQLDCCLPIIFITGHGDIPMAVEAMKLGALDFMRKPLKEQDLIDRINEAMEFDENQRTMAIDNNKDKCKMDLLSAREREVFERVTDGVMNKVIAADLRISERTVEVHRSHVMEKLEAGTFAQLVRIKIMSEQFD
ncbi:response regulator transcription factor [Paraglaciecola sp. L1A13]|uniref:response regulator transcription factor n=1 Tax=Paraglaciecola sp. L1A13 TaxID=2686359 RepID=UPI00131C4A17|nr:response regulator [Paraglaciecola sp. L1A13]